MPSALSLSFCIVFDVYICAEPTVQPISICTQSLCMLNKSNCSWCSIWWIASWCMFYSCFPCFVMAFSSVEMCKQLVIWFSWFVDIYSKNDKRFETFSCFIWAEQHTQRPHKHMFYQRYTIDLSLQSNEPNRKIFKISKKLFRQINYKQIQKLCTCKSSKWSKPGVTSIFMG